MPQNKMGTAPIPKLMLKMGAPMILSMVLQAFYNIVDSYFVGQLPNGKGEIALNALTLAFPIQMLMIAIGVGTGVGVNSLLSRSLGAGDRERASRIAGNAIFTGIVTYVVFLFLGLFAVNAYLRSQTSDADVLAKGEQYLSICLTLSFGAILFMIYEKLLQATGRTLLSTIAQIVGALTNIILDPIMIFGWRGCPSLGIAGAAYATVIGQVLSLILGIIFHMKFNKDVNGSLRYIKPKKSIIGDIYIIGIPAILMQALMSFQTYGVNIIFAKVSEGAVTAYGVYYKVQQFVYFAAFGMNNALIPIVAFNFGAQNRERVKAGIKWGLLYTLGIMLIGAAILQAIAAPLMSVFGLSEATTKLGIAAVRIITLGYLFAGANITFQGVFQAFGRGVSSLIVSAVRLLIVALPIAWIFSIVAPASIWWSFPIAEAVALFVVWLLNKQIKY